MSCNPRYVYPRKTCSWCQRQVDARRFKDGRRRCQRCVDAVALADGHGISVRRGEGAKHCCQCKAVGRFSPDPDRSQFCVTGARAGGYNVRCKTCELERVMEYTRAHPEGKQRRDERYRERLRRDPAAYARVRAVGRASSRKRYQRIRKDPERWGELLANNRIYYRLKAEREGRKITRIVRGGVVAGYIPSFGNGGEHLPEAPLRAWLEAVILCKGNNLDFGALARELGTNERQLRSIRMVEYATRLLSLADTMLTYYGRPVDVPGYGWVWRVEDLWPVEFGEESIAA